jgi:hypothetical protein
MVFEGRDQGSHFATLDKNPYPCPRVRVFEGKGKGRPGMTPGLPLPITTWISIPVSITT